jgi:hypothetical protein
MTRDKQVMPGVQHEFLFYPVGRRRTAISSTVGPYSIMFYHTLNKFPSTWL